MIRCTVEAGGLLLPVRAQPGASRDRVAGEYREALKVAVTKPPEGGRANAAIAATLAKALGVRKSAVTVVSGRSSRNKLFRVEGATEEQIRALLAHVSADDSGRPGAGRTGAAPGGQAARGV